MDDLTLFEIHREVLSGQGPVEDVLHDLVAEVLPRIQGPDQAANVNRIARMLDRSDLHQRTGETIRRCMKILLVERGYPICSCNKGFYVARSWAEARPCHENWEARTKGLARSCRALREQFPDAP